MRLVCVRHDTGTICRQKSDYDNVDWTAAPDAFLPRAVYRPGDKFGNNVRFRASIDEWPRPSLPGFWPIQENERENWESLCGAELVLYGEEDRTQGERTSRRFAYFTVATEDVIDAIHWLARSDAPLERQELLRRFPHVKLHQGCPNTSDLLRLPRPLTSYYRHIHRRKGQPANARTLIPAILPPGPVHISSVFSIAFLDETTMLGFFGTCLSIVFDFLMRMSGKEDLRHEQLRMLPVVSGWHLPLIRGRALRLVCLTEHYSDLWDRERAEIENGDAWTSTDSRLISAHELPWAALPTRWTRGCALRTDFARRQALIEIDVLVAQALNLTLNELLTIYRVQFPVMHIYETKDEYDSQGQRLPNTVRKDPGGKEMRETRKTHDGAGPITATWKVDGRRSSVTNTFYPPLTRVDREEDYRRAWATFAARFAAK